MNNQQRAENAIMWIETLLKTRMKQGKDALGDSRSGYCCLGVACKKLNLEYFPFDVEDERLIDLVGIFDAQGRSISNGDFNSNTMIGHEALTYLNDDMGFTFKEIAQRLINQPHEYFRPGVAKLIKKHFAEV